MDIAKVLEKYRKRVLTEAIVKSVAIGAISGFVALILYEFLDWALEIKAAWIGAIVFAVLTAVVGGLLFIFRFRPSMKAVAKRVDELGLEERIITMTEFEKEQSTIYVLQREETIKTLKENGITEKLLKIVLSVPCIIALCFSSVFGLGMTTVSALASAGVIDGGSKVIEDIIDNQPKPQYEIAYEVSSGEGYIEGEIFQIVEKGASTSAVIAVAEEGFAFAYWSDKKTDPYRIDEEVTASATFYAIFLPISDGTEGEGDIPSEGDEPSDLPADYKEGEEGGEESDNGDPAQGAGGKYESNNQVFDGETYYGGQVYRNAYEEALQRIADSQEWSEEDKKLINEYFKTIAKN